MARNIEIKLRVDDWEALLPRLRVHPGVHDRGHLDQRDVFFRCARGRLKLRLISGAPAQLIHYARADAAAWRASDYTIVETADGDNLCTLLEEVLGRRGEVRKRRHLYVIDNLRIHLDEVEGLGRFVEIEAVVDTAHDESACRHRAGQLLHALGLAGARTESRAYIDLLESQPRRR